MAESHPGSTPVDQLRARAAELRQMADLVPAGMSHNKLTKALRAMGGGDHLRVVGDTPRAWRRKAAEFDELADRLERAKSRSRGA